MHRVDLSSLAYVFASHGLQVSEPALEAYVPKKETKCLQK